MHYYDNFDELLQKYPDGYFYYATTKATKKYSDIEYKDNSFCFGKETKGLPEEIIKGNLDRSIRIPMRRDLGRSLNLANSVNIIIYEALRQLDFPNLE